MLHRNHWGRRIAALDPERDFHEIYRLLVTHEFPWDFTQSLSFALFRTYAVPSIGALLQRTGEFTERTQKRYDDTALILDAILVHGYDADGRTALRRMNQMHGAYAIPNDDLRYVLSTFVVVPSRWLDAYGWRRLTPNERRASVNYYRELGRHMGIKDIPATYEEFADLMDDYEREHFALDPGGRAVADATLNALPDVPPNHLLPRKLALGIAFALMDAPLLDAFGYQHPPGWQRRGMDVALRARAAALALAPGRATAKTARTSKVVSYPSGYDVASLGSFPRARSPEPDQAAEPVEPIDTVEPVDTVKPAETREPVEAPVSDESQHPTDPVAPTRPTLRDALLGTRRADHGPAPDASAPTG